jgi:hypothetical protein
LAWPISSGLSSWMKWRPLGGGALDREVARRGQRRPAVFTGAGERLPVVIHFLGAELTLD